MTYGVPGKLVLIASVVAGTLLSAGAASSTYLPRNEMVVRHPTSNNTYFLQRDRYFLQLLQLALDKSGTSYRLSPVQLPPMSENRSEKYLQAKRYDVHWMMTNMRHENSLIPVRIPLYKGLIGWRLLLVHREDETDFAIITTLAQLKRKLAVHGLDWPDTGILVANGFRLRTSLDWMSLFRLLDTHDVDFFPRSVAEIWLEIDSSPSSNIVVESTLAVHYYAAYYFFVSKENAELAEQIEKGLNAAIADGSFDRLFNANFANAIARANLPQRRVLTVNNPLLPAKTPVQRKELWFQPR
ncbi:transporter substrate-binding domain-containing protein [Teredinibacter turnerae]|uniref:transporter substrate-binding domain-containing protein n=1 Tax=Teredinibacter turnerae TaxID=2426 RepID=UPI00055C7D16|nr:transporter substrate-binding domain-containing protein [Teredinibacter turnerae]